MSTSNSWDVPMKRLAITGHRGLPDESARLVEDGLRKEVARHDAAALVGYSCLADGADVLFARVVLERGGSLVVVVPAAEYREGLPVEHRGTYDELCSRAERVIRMDRIASDSTAHMRASERMLDDVDEIVAVWDGKPARGFGGTGDVVEVARQRRIPVTVVWPEGACRD